MQGGDNGKAEDQHNNGFEGIDEPPLPTLARNAEGEPISGEEGDLLVHLHPGAVAVMDRRSSTRAEAGALPSLGKDNTGRYTDAAAVEGNSDWRVSAFKIQAFDCNAPTMINKLHLPDVCFILEKKLPEKLATAKPAWILGEIEVDEPVDLRTEENNLMISDELTMLFNVTKKDVLLLPGCPRLTLHHTALGTVSITFDKRAAGLPEVVSLDVRSDQDLIPTLKYLEHQNARALSDLNNRVEIDYQDHSELCVTEEPEERENRTSSDGTITHQRRESIIVKVSLICDNR